MGEVSKTGNASGSLALERLKLQDNCAFNPTLEISKNNKVQFAGKAPAGTEIWIKRTPANGAVETKKMAIADKNGNFDISINKIGFNEKIEVKFKSLVNQTEWRSLALKYPIYLQPNTAVLQDNTLRIPISVFNDGQAILTVLNKDGVKAKGKFSLKADQTIQFIQFKPSNYDIQATDRVYLEWGSDKVQFKIPLDFVDFRNSTEVLDRYKLQIINVTVPDGSYEPESIAQAAKGSFEIADVSSFYAKDQGLNSFAYENPHLSEPELFRVYVQDEKNKVIVENIQKNNLGVEEYIFLFDLLTNGNSLEIPFRGLEVFLKDFSPDLSNPLEREQVIDLLSKDLVTDIPTMEYLFSAKTIGDTEEVFSMEDYLNKFLYLFNILKVVLKPENKKLFEEYKNQIKNESAIVVIDNDIEISEYMAEVLENRSIHDFSFSNYQEVLAAGGWQQYLNDNQIEEVTPRDVIYYFSTNRELIYNNAFYCDFFKNNSDLLDNLNLFRQEKIENDNALKTFISENTLIRVNNLLPQNDRVKKLFWGWLIKSGHFKDDMLSGFDASKLEAVKQSYIKSFSKPGVPNDKLKAEADAVAKKLQEIFIIQEKELMEAREALKFIDSVDDVMGQVGYNALLDAYAIFSKKKSYIEQRLSIYESVQNANTKEDLNISLEDFNRLLTESIEIIDSDRSKVTKDSIDRYINLIKQSIANHDKSQHITLLMNMINNNKSCLTDIAFYSAVLVLLDQNVYSGEVVGIKSVLFLIENNFKIPKETKEHLFSLASLYSVDYSSQYIQQNYGNSSFKQISRFIETCNLFIKKSEKFVFDPNKYAEFINKYNGIDFLKGTNTEDVGYKIQNYILTFLTPKIAPPIIENDYFWFDLLNGPYKEIVLVILKNFCGQKLNETNLKKYQIHQELKQLKRFKADGKDFIVLKPHQSIGFAPTRYTEIGGGQNYNKVNNLLKLVLPNQYVTVDNLTQKVKLSGALLSNEIIADLNKMLETERSFNINSAMMVEWEERVAYLQKNEALLSEDQKKELAECEQMLLKAKELLIRFQSSELQIVNLSNTAIEDILVKKFKASNMALTSIVGDSDFYREISARAAELGVRTDNLLLYYLKNFHKDIDLVTLSEFLKKGDSSGEEVFKQFIGIINDVFSKDFNTNISSITTEQIAEKVANSHPTVIDYSWNLNGLADNPSALINLYYQYEVLKVRGEIKISQGISKHQLIRILERFISKEQPAQKNKSYKAALTSLKKISNFFINSLDEKPELGNILKIVLQQKELAGLPEKLKIDSKTSILTWIDERVAYAKASLQFESQMKPFDITTADVTAMTRFKLWYYADTNSPEIHEYKKNLRIYKDPNSDNQSSTKAFKFLEEFYSNSKEQDFNKNFVVWFVNKLESSKGWGDDLTDDNVVGEAIADFLCRVVLQQTTTFKYKNKPYSREDFSRMIKEGLVALEQNKDLQDFDLKMDSDNEAINLLKAVLIYVASGVELDMDSSFFDPKSEVKASYSNIFQSAIGDLGEMLKPQKMFRSRSIADSINGTVLKEMKGSKGEPRIRFAQLMVELSPGKINDEYVEIMIALVKEKIGSIPYQLRGKLDEKMLSGFLDAWGKFSRLDSLEQYEITEASVKENMKHLYIFKLSQVLGMLGAEDKVSSVELVSERDALTSYVQEDFRTKDVLSKTVAYGKNFFYDTLIKQWYLGPLKGFTDEARAPLELDAWDIVKKTGSSFFETFYGVDFSFALMSWQIKVVRPYQIMLDAFATDVSFQQDFHKQLQFFINYDKTSDQTPEDLADIKLGLDQSSGVIETAVVKSASAAADIASALIDIHVGIFMFSNNAFMLLGSIGFFDDLKDAWKSHKDGDELQALVYLLSAYLKFTISNHLLSPHDGQTFWDSWLGRTFSQDRYLYKLAKMVTDADFVWEGAEKGTLGLMMDKYSARKAKSGKPLLDKEKQQEWRKWAISFKRALFLKYEEIFKQYGMKVERSKFENWYLGRGALTTEQEMAIERGGRWDNLGLKVKKYSTKPSLHLLTKRIPRVTQKINVYSAIQWKEENINPKILKAKEYIGAEMDILLSALRNKGEVGFWKAIIESNKRLDAVMGNNRGNRKGDYVSRLKAGESIVDIESERAVVIKAPASHLVASQNNAGKVKQVLREMSDYIKQDGSDLKLKISNLQPDGSTSPYFIRIDKIILNSTSANGKPAAQISKPNSGMALSRATIIFPTNYDFSIDDVLRADLKALFENVLAKHIEVDPTARTRIVSKPNGSEFGEYFLTQLRKQIEEREKRISRLSNLAGENTIEVFEAASSATTEEVARSFALEGNEPTALDAQLTSQPNKIKALLEKYNGIFTMEQISKLVNEHIREGKEFSEQSIEEFINKNLFKGTEIPDFRRAYDVLHNLSTEYNKYLLQEVLKSKSNPDRSSKVEEHIGSYFEGGNLTKIQSDIRERIALNYPDLEEAVKNKFFSFINLKIRTYMQAQLTAQMVAREIYSELGGEGEYSQQKLLDFLKKPANKQRVDNYFDKIQQETKEMFRQIEGDKPLNQKEIFDKFLGQQDSEKMRVHFLKYWFVGFNTSYESKDRTPFESQLTSVYLSTVSKNIALNLDAGGGKTETLTGMVVFRNLLGYTTVVGVSNDPNRKEGITANNKIYDRFGLSVAEYKRSNDGENSSFLRNLFKKDVIYCTNSDFLFRQLEDLLNPYKSVLGNEKAINETICLALDEADKNAYFDGSNPAIISSSTEEKLGRQAARKFKIGCIVMKRFLEVINDKAINIEASNKYYVLGQGNAVFTLEGTRLFEQILKKETSDSNNRNAVLEMANRILQVRFKIRDGKEYQIIDGIIRLLDVTRRFNWDSKQEEYHQIIEAMHYYGLRERKGVRGISKPSLPSISLTPKKFMTDYLHSLIYFSGTMTEVEQKMASDHMDSMGIKPHVDPTLHFKPHILTSNKDQKKRQSMLTAARQFVEGNSQLIHIPQTFSTEKVLTIKEFQQYITEFMDFMEWKVLEDKTSKNESMSKKERERLALLSKTFADNIEFKQMFEELGGEKYLKQYRNILDFNKLHALELAKITKEKIKETAKNPEDLKQFEEDYKALEKFIDNLRRSDWNRFGFDYINEGESAETELVKIRRLGCGIVQILASANTNRATNVQPTSEYLANFIDRAVLQSLRIAHGIKNSGLSGIMTEIKTDSVQYIQEAFRLARTEGLGRAQGIVYGIYSVDDYALKEQQALKNYLISFGGLGSEDSGEGNTMLTSLSRVQPNTLLNISLSDFMQKAGLKEEPKGISSILSHILGGSDEKLYERCVSLKRIQDDIKILQQFINDPTGFLNSCNNLQRDRMVAFLERLRLEQALSGKEVNESLNGLIIALRQKNQEGLDVSIEVKTDLNALLRQFVFENLSKNDIYNIGKTIASEKIQNKDTLKPTELNEQIKEIKFYKDLIGEIDKIDLYMFAEGLSEMGTLSDYQKKAIVRYGIPTDSESSVRITETDLKEIVKDNYDKNIGLLLKAKILVKTAEGYMLDKKYTSEKIEASGIDVDFHEGLKIFFAHKEVARFANKKQISIFSKVLSTIQWHTRKGVDESIAGLEEFSKAEGIIHKISLLLGNSDWGKKDKGQVTYTRHSIDEIDKIKDVPNLITMFYDVAITKFSEEFLQRINIGKTEEEKYTEDSLIINSALQKRFILELNKQFDTAIELPKKGKPENFQLFMQSLLDKIFNNIKEKINKNITTEIWMNHLRNISDDLVQTIQKIKQNKGNSILIDGVDVHEFVKNRLHVDIATAFSVQAVAGKSLRTRTWNLGKKSFAWFTIFFKDSIGSETVVQEANGQEIIKTRKIENRVTTRFLFKDKKMVIRGSDISAKDKFEYTLINKLKAQQIHPSGDKKITFTDGLSSESYDLSLGKTEGVNGVAELNEKLHKQGSELRYIPLGKRHYLLAEVDITENAKNKIRLVRIKNIILQSKNADFYGLAYKLEGTFFGKEKMQEMMLEERLIEKYSESIIKDALTGASTERGKIAMEICIVLNINPKEWDGPKQEEMRSTIIKALSFFIYKHEMGHVNDFRNAQLSDLAAGLKDHSFIRQLGELYADFGEGSVLKTIVEMLKTTEEAKVKQGLVLWKMLQHYHFQTPESLAAKQIDIIGEKVGDLLDSSGGVLGDKKIALLTHLEGLQSRMAKAINDAVVTVKNINQFEANMGVKGDLLLKAQQSFEEVVQASMELENKDWSTHLSKMGAVETLATDNVNEDKPAPKAEKIAIGEGETKQEVVNKLTSLKTANPEVEVSLSSSLMLQVAITLPQKQEALNLKQQNNLLLEQLMGTISDPAVRAMFAADLENQRIGVDEMSKRYGESCVQDVLKYRNNSFKLAFIYDLIIRKTQKSYASVQIQEFKHLLFSAIDRALNSDISGLKPGQGVEVPIIEVKGTPAELLALPKETFEVFSKQKLTLNPFKFSTQLKYLELRKANTFKQAVLYKSGATAGKMINGAVVGMLVDGVVGGIETYMTGGSIGDWLKKTEHGALSWALFEYQTSIATYLAKISAGHAATAFAMLPAMIGQIANLDSDMAKQIFIQQYATEKMDKAIKHDLNRRLETYKKSMPDKLGEDRFQEQQLKSLIIVASKFLAEKLEINVAGDSLYNSLETDNDRFYYLTFIMKQNTTKEQFPGFLEAIKYGASVYLIDSQSRLLLVSEIFKEQFGAEYNQIVQGQEYKELTSDIEKISYLQQKLKEVLGSDYESLGIEGYIDKRVESRNFCRVFGIQEEKAEPSIKEIVDLLEIELNGNRASYNHKLSEYMKIKGISNKAMFLSTITLDINMGKQLQTVVNKTVNDDYYELKAQVEHLDSAGKVEPDSLIKVSYSEATKLYDLLSSENIIDQEGIIDINFINDLSIEGDFRDGLKSYLKQKLSKHNIVLMEGQTERFVELVYQSILAKTKKLEIDSLVEKQKQESGINEGKVFADGILSFSAFIMASGKASSLGLGGPLPLLAGAAASTVYNYLPVKSTFFSLYSQKHRNYTPKELAEIKNKLTNLEAGFVADMARSAAKMIACGMPSEYFGEYLKNLFIETLGLHTSEHKLLIDSVVKTIIDSTLNAGAIRLAVWGAKSLAQSKKIEPAVSKASGLVGKLKKAIGGKPDLIKLLGEENYKLLQKGIESVNFSKFLETMIQKYPRLLKFLELMLNAKTLKTVKIAKVFLVIVVLFQIYSDWDNIKSFQGKAWKNLVKDLASLGAAGITFLPDLVFTGSFFGTRLVWNRIALAWKNGGDPAGAASKAFDETLEYGFMPLDTFMRFSIDSLWDLADGPDFVEYNPNYDFSLSEEEKAESRRKDELKKKQLTSEVTKLFEELVLNNGPLTREELSHHKVRFQLLDGEYQNISLDRAVSILDRLGKTDISFKYNRLMDSGVKICEKKHFKYLLGDQELFLQSSKILSKHDRLFLKGIREGLTDYFEEMIQNKNDNDLVFIEDLLKKRFAVKVADSIIDRPVETWLRVLKRLRYFEFLIKWDKYQVKDSNSITVSELKDLIVFLKK